MLFSRARAAALREAERPLEVPTVADQVLTVVEPVADDPGDRPACAATSLATVGYAMFALLRRGDLEDVPSFDEFLARESGVPFPDVEPAPGEDDVFGTAQVDHHFAAVARPTALVEPPAAASGPTHRAELHLVETIAAPAAGTPAVPTQVAPFEPTRTVDPVEPVAALGATAVERPASTAGHTLPVTGLGAGAAPADGALASPIPPAPVPRTSNTLAMLQEISFLDE